jgi:hypothetical protein
MQSTYSPPLFLRAGERSTMLHNLSYYPSNSTIFIWRVYVSMFLCLLLRFSGRFSARGTELGWAKAWMLHLGGAYFFLLLLLLLLACLLFTTPVPRFYCNCFYCCSYCCHKLLLFFLCTPRETSFLRAVHISFQSACEL